MSGRDNGAPAISVRLERGSELLRGDTCLAENASKSANFQLAVVGNDTTRRATAHDNMASSLPHDFKTETLQSADGF